MHWIIEWILWFIWTYKRPIIFLIGEWLVADGVVSIIEYYHQHWYEHAVREIRTAIGVFLMWSAFNLLA